MNHMNEIEFILKNGLKIAAVEWKSKNQLNALTIVAVHGSMDNCASFTPICLQFEKLFTYMNYRIICIDLIGHGKSSHRIGCTQYNSISYVPDLIEVINQLTVQSVILMGHSMGASICLMTSLVVTQRVSHLILFDGLSPQSTTHHMTTKLLVDAIELNSKLKTKPTRIYSTIDQAIDQYQRGNVISRDNAKYLVIRGTIQLIDNQNQMIGYQFRHDPLLRSKTLSRFTSDQVLDLIQSVNQKVLFVGTQSMRGYFEPILKQFKDCSSVTQYFFDSSHHLHMDHAVEVALVVFDFLKSEFQSIELISKL